MFHKFKQNLIFLYTLTTGLILTLVVFMAFLFSAFSQNNRREAAFQNNLFSLTSKLQTDSQFTDAYLAEMELRNSLLIYIEENGHPLFFPGAWEPDGGRDALLDRAAAEAKKEGIYEGSQPISSDLLKSSVFRIKGAHYDTWLGNVLIIRTDSGYKKMILLSDETQNRRSILKTGLLYFLMDLSGIFLLYLSGRRFVLRSTQPLEETYEKQRDFVSAASHELRSPLAVIQANASAIQDAPWESPRLLAVIQSECDRGSALIKNLLLLATADSKSLSLHKQNLEIDDLLLHLLELYEPVFLAKNARLLLELPEETLPYVQGDPQLCLQIFTILLDNAAAYGLEQNSRRKVLLKADCCSGSVCVSVTDYGVGIPDDNKLQIFDRFYRGDRSRSHKEHFGLGLSIAAELANAQGLDLDVQDTPGGGCTFVVRFHVAQG